MRTRVAAALIAKVPDTVQKKFETYNLQITGSQKERKEKKGNTTSLLQNEKLWRNPVLRKELRKKSEKYYFHKIVSLPHSLTLPTAELRRNQI